MNIFQKIWNSKNESVDVQSAAIDSVQFEVNSSEFLRETMNNVPEGSKLTVSGHMATVILRLEMEIAELKSRIAQLETRVFEL